VEINKVDTLAVKNLDNNIIVIEPQRKRLDAAFAIKFREDTLEIVKENTSKVIFDLGQIEFMDSSGLGALVSIMKALGGNQNMALCQVKDAVLTVFRLTRMDKIFVIVPSEAEAVVRLS